MCGSAALICRLPDLATKECWSSGKPVTVPKATQRLRAEHWTATTSIKAPAGRVCIVHPLGWEGALEGTEVGTEGFVVGCLEGCSDGLTEGWLVGTIDGCEDGCLEGVALGCAEGCLVGYVIG